jgi:uncharacterized protein
MGLGLSLLFAQVVPAGAQNRNIRACLSIANVNERVDCLEGHTPAPVPSPTAPYDIRRQPQARVAPSFDCRAADTSIERAICSDDELAQWDSRMGQAFQQALRFRKDGQALLEGQRRWIIQRDRTCGGTSEIPFSCLLEMTKQRASALSEDIAGAVSAAPQQTPPPPPAVAPPPTTSAAIPRSIPGQTENNPKVLSDQNNNAATPQPALEAKNLPASPLEQGPSPVIPLIAVAMALWLGVKVVRDIQRRQRRQSLIAKYGQEAAERILAGEVWQGMTGEQLVDSWGSPVEVGSEIVRNRSKETWKFGQTGKNRFSNRVYLENGIVIGWKN